jgi:hypothetical protein
MRIRALLIGFLALAVFTGSASQASFLQFHPAPAHDHHAVHEHGAAAHHHSAPQDQKQDSALKCCGLCVIASSAAPVAACAVIALIPSRIFYPPAEDLGFGRVVVLDPGIPKQSA